MKHDWQSVPMPERLASRPKDVRGFPITFVTLIESDGRPDFTTIDGRKIVRCITEGLCGMCGLSFYVDEPVAFIGGPLAIENANFLDPPMHVECAEYAFQVCPHIAIDTSRYSKPNLGGPEGRELFTAVDPNRPEKFGILLASPHGYQVVPYQGQPVFLVNDRIGVSWEAPIPADVLPAATKKEK